MNNKSALTYGLSAVLLWSTVATAFKITLSYMSPAQMLLVASVVSTLFLLAIVGWQGNFRQIGTTFRQRPFYYLLLGLLNPFAYYLVLFKAYTLLPASFAQPVSYSWAISFSLLAALFLGQKIRRQDAIAAVLGYVGVVIIATKGDLLGLEFDSPLGLALVLCSTLLWSGYWILNAKNQADPVIGLLLSFLISLPFSFGVNIYNLSGLNDWSTIAWQGWIAASYIGLFEMGITFVLWLKAIKLASNTSQISNLIFISPFISLVLLNQIIGEEIHFTTLIGLSMIVIGLWLQQRNK